MNFIPCRLEQAGDGPEGAAVRQHRASGAGGPRRALPAARGQATLTFGLRPEHITEAKRNGETNVAPFDAGARGGRADGHGDAWCSSRSTAPRSAPASSPNAGARGRRQSMRLGGEPRPHAPDRQRDRPGAVSRRGRPCGKGRLGDRRRQRHRRGGGAGARRARAPRSRFGPAARAAAGGRGQDREAGGKALVAPADMGEQEAAEPHRATIAKEFGRLDILVNNAGANITERSWAKLTPERIKSCSTPISTARSIARRGARDHAAAEGRALDPYRVDGRPRRRALVGPELCRGQARRGGDEPRHQHGGVSARHPLHRAVPGEVATPILDRRPMPVSAEDRARMLQPEHMADLIVYVAKQPAERLHQRSGDQPDLEPRLRAPRRAWAKRTREEPDEHAAHRPPFARRQCRGRGRSDRRRRVGGGRDRAARA